MHNEIQKFTSEQFGTIRTAVLDGKPWFVGKDVAVALGYSNPRKALADHVDEEDKRQGDGVTIRDSIGREQHPTLINESGLYALILSSKLHTAKQFKRWVTHDVIPAIRQHGAYFTDETLRRLLSDPTQAHLLVMEYVQEALENERLKYELQTALPKAKYYDTFVNPMECTNIRVTAKELGVPEKRFTKYLMRHRYLYRAPSGKLMPYANYYNKGFFIIRDFHKRNSAECGQYTLITATGKAHFMSKVPAILWETE